MRPAARRELAGGVALPTPGTRVSSAPAARLAMAG